jgi:phosphoglycerate kinase
LYFHGRPIEGEVSDEFTLQPVADRLSELLGVTVRLEKNWLDGVEMSPALMGTFKS